MTMSDTTPIGPQPMFGDETVYQELVDRHGKILGPPVHSQPTKQGTDPRTGNTIQVPNPDSPLRYSFEDGSLVDVSPDGGLQIVRTGKGIDPSKSSPKVTHNASGQLVQIMDGQETVIDPTTRPEKPHITKTGDGRTIEVWPDGRTTVVDASTKPQKPTIRTNATGQLVSVDANNNETVVDSTVKPDRPGSTSGRSSDHPPLREGKLTWIWNATGGTDGKGGYELPAGTQMLNPRGWPTNIKDPYGNDLFLTGTNDDGTPQYQGAPDVPRTNVHSVTGTDRNSPTTVARDANGAVLWTTPNAGYVNPLANTLSDESSAIEGIKQQLASGGLQPDEASQMMDNIRTSMRATSLGMTPDAYLARQQSQADLGRGLIGDMLGRGQSAADKFLDAAKGARGLGGMSFSPYSSTFGALGGNATVQQAMSLISQVQPVNDRASAFDAMSKYATVKHLLSTVAGGAPSGPTNGIEGGIPLGGGDSPATPTPFTQSGLPEGRSVNGQPQDNGWQPATPDFAMASIDDPARAMSPFLAGANAARGG